MQNIKETEEYIVVEFTSGFGNSYEVGYPKADGDTKEIILQKIAEADEKHKANESADAADYQPLNWRVDDDSITYKGAIKIGIVGGYVTKDNGWIYTYRVYFGNNRDWMFTFKDETGDTYFCTTILNRVHYIDYNSAKPLIMGVK